MASDVQSVTNPASSLVHGSQALTTTSVIQNSGKNLPQNGKTAAPTAGFPPSAATQQIPAPQQVASAQSKSAEKTQAAQQEQVKQQAATAALPSQIAALNKYLNDSGRPAQFRASSDDKTIEEINPATGQVVAEYSATEFAALARSVGISGAVVNSHA